MKGVFVGNLSSGRHVLQRPVLQLGARERR